MSETREAAVAVIGYGTAGVNACIGLRNAGYTGPVRVFSDTATRPYSPILTSYYAAGLKEYEQCFPWTEDELADLDLEVLSGEAVTRLDTEAHVVYTAQGAYPYSKCVIASGSSPVPFGFPKDCGYEPLQPRTMDDAQRLKDVLDDPSCQRVLVSGASMVALKTLEACLEHGKDVTLVGLNPHVLDFNALPQAAQQFEDGLVQLGATLRLGNPIATVERIEEEGRERLRVTFRDGDVDTFDAISVAHGMKSNLDFLEPEALEMDRALLVDEFMRTSDPDVYAAGDVAQALELVSGSKRIVGIWKNAAVQGEVAGRAIAAELAGRTPGLQEAYGGSIPTNTIAVENMLFISGGTMELSEGRVVEERRTQDTLVLYIFECADNDSKRLVGFNLVCDHSDEGSPAYDTGAMLTMRIEQGCRQAAGQS